jgi:glyceraldehyde 3-phosphate dehydrogenase
VNDLSDIHTLAHLLKYDSVHGHFPIAFQIEGDVLLFENGKKIQFTKFDHPSKIPWSEFGVEYVIESTGKYTSKQEASLHVAEHSTLKRVIISAPSSSDDVKTVVMGVNEHLINAEDLILSNASCTTNNAAPMIAVLKSICEIESGFVTTIHSYTSDQRLHDSPHKDLRRARAANQSIIPTTTGAAKALNKIFPDLEDKLGGCGVRVPVPNGSFTDITLVVKNAPSFEEINQAMLKASQTNLKGILGYTEDPIVSVDIIGNPLSCLFDAELTSVVGHMVKVVGWYDNEAGYSNRMVDLLRYLG